MGIGWKVIAILLNMLSADSWLSPSNSFLVLVSLLILPPSLVNELLSHLWTIRNCLTKTLFTLKRLEAMKKVSSRGTSPNQTDYPQGCLDCGCSLSSLSVFLLHYIRLLYHSTISPNAPCTVKSSLQSFI